MLDGRDKKKGSQKEPCFSGDSPWGWSYLERAHSAPCTSSCAISENAFPLWFCKSFLCWFAPKCCAFPGHKLLKQLCSAKGKIGRPTWAFQSEDQTPCLSSSSSEQAWLCYPRQEVMQLPERPPVSLVWQGNRGCREAYLSSLHFCKFPRLSHWSGLGMEGDSQRPAEATFRYSLSGKRIC